VALLALLAAALGSFAVPVPSWRAGEAERRQASASDDPTQRFHPASGSTRCACGHGRRTDPDDCLGVLGIARSDGIEIAGVSTIFGNAELAVAHRTTRELAHRLAGPALPSPRLRA
jgi:hypothetical protein